MTATSVRTQSARNVEAEPTAGHRRKARPRGPWLFFVADCVLAVVVRLVLAWYTPGYTTDRMAFQSWAETLRSHPLGSFYAAATQPDHLPGDLWVLKATATAFDALGGRDLHGAVFGFVLQVVPTLGDLLVALLVVLIVRDRAGLEVAGRCGRWYLLNPASIVLTGIWGQWDSVSLAMLMTGVWLLLRDRWWLASAPLLTWAVLVKPPLAVPVVLLVVLLGGQRIARQGRSPRRPLLHLAVGVAWVGPALVTAYLVLAPFGVHLLRAPHGGSTLAERAHAAVALYPFTTVGAANVWMLPLGSLRRVRDDVPGLWGLTAEQCGVAAGALLVAFLCAIGARRLRRADLLVTAVWAATGSVLVLFYVLTRSHERYAFPALGLCLVLVGVTGFERRLVRTFWLLSICFTLNLMSVLYGGFPGLHGERVSFGPWWWVPLAAAYCWVVVRFLQWPFAASSAVGGTRGLVVVDSSTERAG